MFFILEYWMMDKAQDASNVTHNTPSPEPFRTGLDVFTFPRLMRKGKPVLCI
jgi:hypothetical protein